MKVFGFIKEYHDGALNEVAFSKIEKVKDYSDRYSVQVLNYMRRAPILISMLSTDFDLETGEKISAHNIKTDGEWLWPEYCPHYIEKDYCLDVPKEFIDHVVNNGYVAPELTERLHKKMFKVYCEVTNQPLPRGIKFE